MTGEDFFSHLDDALTGADAAAALKKKAEDDKIMPLVSGHSEKCPKCHGSGQFVTYHGRILGPCRACRGKGTVFFRTSRQERDQNKARRVARAANRVDKVRAAFAAAHPDEWQWMNEQQYRFPFAQAMLGALDKYESLTEKQLAVVIKCTAEARARLQAQKAAPGIDVSTITQSFKEAQAHGIKYPKLRLAHLVFALAGPASRTPGAVFVTRAEDKLYLGKVVDDRLLTVRACTAELQADIVRVAADPKAAAIAYGKEYGQCSCCGRELSNPESVALGIGPICATHFGW